MKIQICRSGGFAGLRRTATVETDHLPAAQASALIALKASGPKASTHPDAFTYEISFPEDASPRTVHLDESAAAACGLTALFKTVA